MRSLRDLGLVNAWLFPSGESFLHPSSLPVESQDGNMSYHLTHSEQKAFSKSTNGNETLTLSIQP